MTSIPPSGSALSGKARRARPAARALAGWSLAWISACLLGAALLIAAGAPTVAWTAVAAGAVPPLFGLRFPDGASPATAVIVLWGVVATFAVVLTGGLPGPMGAWALAPLAAGAATGRVQLAAQGGAFSLAVLGVAVLAAFGAPAVELGPWMDYGMRVLASVTTVGGLAAAVVLLQRRTTVDFWRLAESEARLKRLLEEQPSLVMSLTASGRVRAVFGPAPAGVPAVRLSDHPVTDAAAPEDRPRIEEALRQARIDGAAELRFTPADDPTRVALLVLRRVNDTRLIANIRSDHLQAEREAELEQARADAEAQNAGKSRFLANMSHELRTPLNAIMGFSDIMRQRLFGPISDRYAEYAELVHESGGHLLDLINDVLDMSKIEAERFELAREEFDARDAVSAVLRLMRGQADRAAVQLRGVLPRESLEVDADRRAIKQIALNLISNALKFTPRNGAVTVTLQAVDGVLELVVADTGVGIAPDDLKRIGRPFEQAGDAEKRAAGTGLGLSLVRAFSELHGGEMSLESRLGEGTTVTVRLPVLLQAEPPPAAPRADVPNLTIH